MLVATHCQVVTMSMDLVMLPAVTIWERWAPRNTQNCRSGLIVIAMLTLAMIFCVLVHTGKAVNYLFLQVFSPGPGLGQFGVQTAFLSAHECDTASRKGGSMISSSLSPSIPW